VAVYRANGLRLPDESQPSLLGNTYRRGVPEFPTR